MSDVTLAHIRPLPAHVFALAGFPSRRWQRVYLLERTESTGRATPEVTMNKLTAALAALALAACGQTDPAQQYRDALPKSQAAELGTYQSGTGTAGALSAARQPLGDSTLLQSEYAVQSYWLALGVNGGAKAILDLVQFITRFPTSSCDDTTCAWGPWVGDQGLNRYQLVVTKNGDAYDYVLSGQNAVVAGSPFVDILTGTAYPVAKDRGHGTFTLDFDASDAGLAHGPAYVKKDYGQLVVNYDNTQSPTVGALFLGARNQDPNDEHFMNAAYAFDASASGGQLQVAVENLDTGDTLTLRTRWSTSGQGRADVLFTAGAGGSLTASECWAGRSQDFIEVYDTKHLDLPQLRDANGCSPFSTFEAADISLP